MNSDPLRNTTTLASSFTADVLNGRQMLGGKRHRMREDFISDLLRETLSTY
jgi:hypothetical protein